MYSRCVRTRADRMVCYPKIGRSTARVAPARLAPRDSWAGPANSSMERVAKESRMSQQIEPAGPLALIEVREGRLIVGGTAIPERDEIERLCEWIARYPDELASVLAGAWCLGIGLRAAVGARDWHAVELQRLLVLNHCAQSLEIIGRDLGGPARLQFGLLLRGFAEGRGFRPFAVADYFFAARAPVRAELERRAEGHTTGIAAAGIAVPKAPDRSDTLELGQAVEHLRRRVKLPLSAQGLAQRTDARRFHGGSLVEPFGQIPVTIANEIDASDPLRAIADAIEGKLDLIPASVTRDLRNDAEHHRRWEWRKGKHAKGPARLSIGLDANPLDDDDDAEPSESGPRPKRSKRPRTGREAEDAAIFELSLQEREAREFVLDIEADAVDRMVAELERNSRGLAAQRLRKTFYRKLGGKAQRIPETRNRRRGKT